MFLETQDIQQAWAPYKPSDERPWSLELAGHLFRRAAFGSDWNQLQAAVKDGPAATIDRLLKPDADLVDFNSTQAVYEDAAASSGSAEGLRAWWLRRMITTPHPLLEKMTLFWHGHFGAGNVRVKSGQLMHDHIGLLRADALGSYESLLVGVSNDPAMLVGMAAEDNRRAMPNDRFARQLFDRLGPGPGAHTEADVAEAARAFTGRRVLRSVIRDTQREHDPGVKNILGQEGEWRGADVVRIVLEQPATSRTIVRSLYRWLISEVDEPDDALIAPLAKTFAADYDIGRLVETMLRSNAFFSPAAYRRRVKSPVEFALGIVRPLEAMIGTGQLGIDLAEMGQNLYHPPTVKGWEGGRHWINAASSARRANLAAALLSGEQKPYGAKLDPAAVAEKHGADAIGPFLVDLFLQGDLDASVLDILLEETGDPATQARRLAHAIVTLPEFQLA